MAAIQAVDELLEELNINDQTEDCKQHENISDIASKVHSFKLSHPNCTISTSCTHELCLTACLCGILPSIFKMLSLEPTSASASGESEVPLKL